MRGFLEVGVGGGEGGAMLSFGVLSPTKTLAPTHRQALHERHCDELARCIHGYCHPGPLRLRGLLRGGGAVFGGRNQAQCCSDLFMTTLMRTHAHTLPQVSQRMPLVDYQQHANFLNVGNAVQLLTVIGTGDSWEDVMIDYLTYAKPHQVWTVRHPYYSCGFRSSSMPPPSSTR